MIGKVDFVMEGKPVSLTLSEDGAFACQDADAGDHFAAILERHNLEYSPADGVWGVKALEEFADFAEGNLTLEQKPEPATVGGRPNLH